jgi:hypothetical protein
MDKLLGLNKLWKAGWGKLQSGAATGGMDAAPASIRLEQSLTNQGNLMNCNRQKNACHAFFISGNTVISGNTGVPAL